MSAGCPPVLQTPESMKALSASREAVEFMSNVAYISPQMETLEQHHHEYFKMKAQCLDIKIHMKRQDDKMVINKFITQGQQVQEETVSHDLSSLTGFISEASNLLIMRLLARRKNIENMDFLAFDADTKLCTLTYRQLGFRYQVIGKTTVEVYGLERTIHSEDIPTTWQCYFLPDGHLFSRVQVGTDITMKITQMPILSEPEEEDPKPVFEQKALNFEEDAQLLSEFQDRKEELISEHETYLRRHPEIKILLGDFMQFLLLRKPDDIIAFAADFFHPFSPAQEHRDTFPIFQGCRHKL
ncbi:ciliogenesis-associated TTC17-interacting protein isoform X2 [Pseudophryne corroboree]|uniref:ciliogenesis-associated TTC17-interacting protein isoform X2 n=1 Tax=Pseudophryne corroboree TaxID=495146 RepID=UPI003082158E